MPGTFYVPPPRRRPISDIDCESLDTTHRGSFKNTQVEKKLYVHLLIKVDALLEEYLAYTFSALMIIDFAREGSTREITVSSSRFNHVGMMLSRLEKE